jgi:hypothetical protein
MATANAMFDRVQRKSSDKSDGLWQQFFSGRDAPLVLAHSAAVTREKLDASRCRDAGFLHSADRIKGLSRNEYRILLDFSSAFCVAATVT